MALLPAGFFALSWRERISRLSREARGLLALLAGGSLRRRLEVRRRRILQELAELARLLPESAPIREVAETVIGLALLARVEGGGPTGRAAEERAS